MIDETSLVNEFTLVSDDDNDDIPVAVCYRCGLVAGPDWDEVILGAEVGSSATAVPQMRIRPRSAVDRAGPARIVLAGPIFLLGEVPWQTARSNRAGPWLS